VLARST